MRQSWDGVDDGKGDVEVRAYRPIEETVLCQESLLRDLIGDWLYDQLEIQSMACEFYPSLNNNSCVCGCGSDVGGAFVCTSKFSETCMYAIEARKTLPIS